jgi:Kef-type K+ transport system membrane component KefB
LDLDRLAISLPIRTAITVAAGLTQIGELSFVVTQAARSEGRVAGNVFSTVIAASLISILLNSFIVRRAFAWSGGKIPEPGVPQPVAEVSGSTGQGVQQAL